MSRRPLEFIATALGVAIMLLLVRVAGVDPSKLRDRVESGISSHLPPLSWTKATHKRVFFASPSGHHGSAGSATDPLDLTTALSVDGPLRPGDLLWLRGGTYQGNFRSGLAGTADAFIVVAQFPGERAILDGGQAPDQSVLRVDGSHTVYWGFEVTNSAPDEADHVRGTGVDVFGPYTKFVNMVVHHTGNGMGIWTPALDAEVYGNLIYRIGWDAEDRGHGHSIYVQNDASTKRVVDNILFDGRSFGVHAYTEGGEINNLYFEGNIAFDHGSLSKVTGAKANFLIGGRQVARHPVLLSNYAYYPWSSVGRNADVGYIDGCSDALIRGNYLAGGVPVVVTRCTETTMTGNRFIGAVDPAIESRFPDNQFIVERPQESRVFVRPNRYVKGRGNVAVFNWARRSSLRIDLSGLGLRTGEPFEIRDVRNYFGEPLLTSTYGASSIELSLHNMMPSPTDASASALPPEFGAAVVIPIRRGIANGLPWKKDADR